MELTLISSMGHYRFDLDPEMPTVIGSGEHCRLRITNDVYVSQAHCVITPMPGGHWMIEDYGSMNGTYLDHRQIYGPTQLGKLHNLRVGRTAFVVVDRANADALMGAQP